jgi:hypothetical protein
VTANHTAFAAGFVAVWLFHVRPPFDEVQMSRLSPPDQSTPTRFVPVASDARKLPPRAVVSSRTVHELHSVRGEQYEEEYESSPGDVGRGSDPSVRIER